MRSTSNAVVDDPLVAQPRLFRPVPLSRSENITFYGSFGLLLFAPLAFGAVEPWSIFVVEITASALLLIWLLAQIRSRSLHIAHHALFVPAMAFMALVLAQIVASHTAYRYRTTSAALQYVGYGILAFLVTQCFRRTSQVQKLAWIFSAFGGAVAVGAILQSISGTSKIFWLRPSAGWIYGPYANHNHYAGLMELLTPIPLVFALSHLGHQKHRLWAASIAVVMACSIFLSGSRGGMVALSAQLLLLGTAALRDRNKRELVIIIGAFVLVGAGLLTWLGGAELFNRIASFQQQAHTELSSGTRLAIARDSIAMFRQRPILGWGLATFPDVYPRFRSFYTNFFVNAAHDDYIQLLVETGLAGFAITVWFLIILYRKALRKLENWPSDTNGAVALAAILGCTGILVHSFFDFNLQIPANAALFYAFCAIAAMPARFGGTRRISRRPALVPTTPSE